MPFLLFIPVHFSSALLPIGGTLQNCWRLVIAINEDGISRGHTEYFILRGNQQRIFPRQARVTNPAVDTTKVPGGSDPCTSPD